MRKQDHLPRGSAMKDRAEAEIQLLSSQSHSLFHQSMLGEFSLDRGEYELVSSVCTSNAHSKVVMSSLFGSSPEP